MALKPVRDGGSDPDHGSSRQPIVTLREWLSTPTAAEDLVVELATAQEKFVLLDEALSGASDGDRVIELFQARCEALGTSLKRWLVAAELPIAESLRESADSLAMLFGETAGLHQRAFSTKAVAADVSERPEAAIVAARALKCLFEQYQLLVMVGASVPPGLWRNAHRCYAQARRESKAPSLDQPDAERTYRELLALAAAQPATLSPIEVLSVVEYLSRFSATVEIARRSSPDADDRSFWFDPTGDFEPVAVKRKAAPSDGDIVFVSCSRLGQLAAEQVREIEAGTPPDHLHLPPQANEPVFRGLLRRLQESWIEPPARNLSRRRLSYEVSALVGFEAVRQRLAGDTQNDAGHGTSDLSTWIVLNESPAGFALKHAGGETRGLTTGGVIAIRNDESRAWDVCVVRWLRSEVPGQVEIGVQLLSNGAQVVRIAFRNTRNPQPPVDGLLVPAVPAVRANEAILVPAGTCTSRRFLMVTDADRTRVAQGRMVNLDLQTACVELLEFQPDPYPI
jgi:hypothetical protein